MRARSELRQLRAALGARGTPAWRRRSCCPLLPPTPPPDGAADKDALSARCGQLSSELAAAQAEGARQLAALKEGLARELRKQKVCVGGVGC